MDPVLNMLKRSSPKTNGTGYAGDSKNSDAARRKKLQKIAQNKEEITALHHKAILQSAVTNFCYFSLEPSGDILNTMKCVLRNQDHWSSVSKCKVYEIALDCCQKIIISRFPKLLGNEDDDESLLAALLETTSSAQIIIQHAKDYSLSVQRIAQRVLQVKDQAILALSLLTEDDNLNVMDHNSHYRRSLRPFAFQFVEDLPNHYFAKTTKNYSSDSHTMSSTQRKRILRELTTYQTTLPIEYGSSIFVRTMESRMDLLRVMISGPSDSPYSCGCFFFDIHLNDYPNKPPNVKFLTTGGGKYRFNPNLYPDGKVCLSLLGTWEGPGWQPGESTLLQVLVSIQSLIFIDQPYFNEPGYQCSEGTASGNLASKEYNRNIRKYTIDAAILPYIRQTTTSSSPTLLFPEFNEVIEVHFRLKCQALKKQLFQWYQEENELLNSKRRMRQESAIPTMNKLFEECLDIFDSKLKKKQKSKLSRMIALPSCSKPGDTIEIDDLGCVVDNKSFSIGIEKNEIIEIDLDENKKLPVQEKIDNVVDLT